jgi:hypothetical protein
VAALPKPHQAAILSWGYRAKVVRRAFVFVEMAPALSHHSCGGTQLPLFKLLLVVGQSARGDVPMCRRSEPPRLTGSLTSRHEGHSEQALGQWLIASTKLLVL